MPPPNIGTLRAVADCLDKLGLDYAFVGGSIVSLLVDDPELSPARVTDDVDVILEVVTSERYSNVEARLRSLGFDHDMREGEPRCRWVLGNLTVDIMPTEGAFLGLNTAWFKEALATAVSRKFAHISLRLISPVAFLATKHVAFLDRGKNDYYASHDLEDFVTVIDGRANIVDELNQAPSALRAYVIGAVRDMHAIAPFNEALSGHLPSDQASQQRLPMLRKKLRDIAALSVL
jgi:predicted nucleotidyltransferase